ncbi:hypothetical protein VP501E541_P0127 [Vibrio phage 501E54-1]|nr:hypothetical protein VP501E541_P0127 [Vibrio phage 501E54-1]
MYIQYTLSLYRYKQNFTILSNYVIHPTQTNLTNFYL